MASGTIPNDMHPVTLVGQRVLARQSIRQSPLSNAPDVPAGCIGTVEDYDGSSGHYLVDFGARYGVIIATREELI